MKKEQRICVLLAIMILGIWGLEAKSSGSLIPKSWKIRMIQSVQENAERLYMPGVTSVSYTHLTLPTTPYV